MIATATGQGGNTQGDEESRYRQRENQRAAVELIAGAALARYAQTTANGTERALAERVQGELMRRAATLLGLP